MDTIHLDRPEIGPQPAPQTKASGLAFYDDVPHLSDFTRVGDESAYRALPEGWIVGIADIERSTDAVAAGRYKEVNTVAAAVIAAVANVLSGRDFPFVFGGDGAGFALPAEQSDLAAGAMAAVAGWARDAFGLHLRIAIVSVETIRTAGRDVRVARFCPSPDVSYAMFHGGGLAWAEARMKDGEFRLDPASGDAARPDLTGLSCRFSPVAAQRGLILSLIVVPDGEPGEAFAALVRDLLRLAADSASSGSPVPAGGPPLRWPSAGLGIEARAAAAARRTPLWRARLSVGLRTLLAFFVFKSRRKVGGFDPARYIDELVRNSDFRKFDDGLRMTLDCTPVVADAIAARLSAAEAEGIAVAGLHRQDEAMLTCFTPSPTSSDHVHFVDGAMGGYAAAAAMAFRRARPAAKAA
ncbi:DUF3095 domain-containing protein [Jiella sp. M17.18]|uniref:DUF3095 domain-containing protein n=1 Tax=Jiella sp. M17.18 TaxID=3234247 RepID=UPI0034DE8EDA